MSEEKQKPWADLILDVVDGKLVARLGWPMDRHPGFPPFIGVLEYPVVRTLKRGGASVGITKDTRVVFVRVRFTGKRDAAWTKPIAKQVRRVCGSISDEDVTRLVEACLSKTRDVYAHAFNGEPEAGWCYEFEKFIESARIRPIFEKNLEPPSDAEEKYRSARDRKRDAEADEYLSPKTVQLRRK